MKTLAIRTAVTSVYALVAYLGAAAIWDASDSAVLYAEFFAWNMASAALFVYVVTRLTGRSPWFVAPVFVCGPLLQVSTVAVFVQQSLGESLDSALLALPVFLGNVIPAQPGLFTAWFGLPVLAGGIMLYLNSARSRVDAMHT